MTTERIRTAALTAALLLAAASPGTETRGQDDGFRLHVDSLSVGFLELDVDTGSAKFGEYRDLGTGFQLSDLRIRGEGAGGDRFLSFSADAVRRDDAHYRLLYGYSGRYSLEVDYDKIPHRFGNGATLLWSRTAPGAWEISDAVQAQIQGAMEARLASGGAVSTDFLAGLLAPHLAAAHRLDLGLQRDRTRITLELGKLGRLAWTAELRHENREGLRPYGGSFGFGNATEIPEPIDYDTTDGELRGEWNGERGGLIFGLRHSTFENRISTLVWDNPFRAVDSTDPRAYLGPGGASINGPGRGFADLAPDNEAQVAFLSGRGRFGGWWAHGTASYNLMTQDDPLLPLTLNTSIAGIDPATGATFDASDPANLPVQRADTEVAVTSFTGTAGTRLAKDWQLRFRVRYYDYDNVSPRVELPGYVRTHAAWQEVPRITVPYSYTREDLGAELAWQAAPATSLTLGYRRLGWDRKFRETETTDEDLLELSLDQRLGPKAGLRAVWEHGERSNGGYEVEAQELTFLDPAGINNQPGLRKFTQAARDFDQYSLGLNLLPAPAWNVAFTLSGRDESYPESEFGLIGDEIAQAGFEVGYTPGAAFGCHLFGHRADRRVVQRARQSGGTLSESPLDDWQATLDEVTDTWGLGFSGEKGGWRWEGTGRWSRSDGEGDFFTPPGGSPSEAVDIDNYEDVELVAFEAEVSYEFSPSLGLALSYLFEDYTLDSFILQGVQPFLPAALQLAAENGDYRAHVVGLSLRMGF